MKFILHENSVQLMPETPLDVEMLERWQCKKFQANDMAIVAGATGIKRYPYGLSLRLMPESVDRSEDATRKRVRSYTNAQLLGLQDTLQLAVRPLCEEEQRYFDTLRDECVKELKRRGLEVTI